MIAVILAGGLGSRLSEETHNKPKPMVEIGGKPILWHIMKIYASHNIREFIICCGYKQNKIKQYFKNYSKKNTNAKIIHKNNFFEIIKNKKETWKVRLVNTGLKTLTGGRLKRVRKYLKNEEFFFFTYGDGVAKLNMKSQIKFHRQNKKICTVLAVSPPSRYGALEIKKNGEVKTFDEKPEKGEGLITNVLTKLVKMKEMAAFTKYDFWHPMDTLRDKNFLEKKWQNKKAAWKNWK